MNHNNFGTKNFSSVVSVRSVCSPILLVVQLKLISMERTYSPHNRRGSFGVVAGDDKGALVKAIGSFVRNATDTVMVVALPLREAIQMASSLPPGEFIVEQGDAKVILDALRSQ